MIRSVESYWFRPSPLATTASPELIFHNVWHRYVMTRKSVATRVCCSLCTTLHREIEIFVWGCSRGGGDHAPVETLILFCQTIKSGEKYARQISIGGLQTSWSPLCLWYCHQAQPDQPWTTWWYSHGCSLRTLHRSHLENFQWWWLVKTALWWLFLTMTSLWWCSSQLLF